MAGHFTIKRTLLIAAILIVVVWIGAVCFAAIAAPEPFLLVFTLPYLLVLYFSRKMLRKEFKSETLKRLAILYCIIGVGSVFFFAWVYYNFALNFKW